MLILHLSVTQARWCSQFLDLSSRFAEDPEEGIFEDFRGNLKDSLSSRFTFSEFRTLTVDFALFDATNLMVRSDFPFDHSIFRPLFKVECRCQRSTREQWFHDIWHCEIDGTNNFSSLTSFSSDGPRMWGICSVFMYFFCYVLCCTDPCLMFDVGSCFLTCSMILTWCDAESFVRCTCCCDSSCFVWDPFVVMLMGYSCVTMYVCIEICFMPCRRDAHYHHAWVLCHTDRSPFLTESSCSGTSLGATPAWRHFPCKIVTSPLMYIITIDNT